jgi:hypothetical protein
MTVYVDDMRAPFGRLVMAHMIADTDEELHEMANLIGIRREWHQAPPRYNSHYDISMSKRKLAVERGAIEITIRQTAAMCARRRDTGILGDPADAIAWFCNRNGLAPDDVEPVAPVIPHTPDLFG